MTEDHTTKQDEAPKRSKSTTNLRKLEQPKLDAKHLEELRASGLSDETIAAAQLYTERDNREIRRLLNFTRTHDFGPSIVFPYFDINGAVVGHRVKPGNPRKWRKPGGKMFTAKYESAKGERNRLYLPPPILDGLKNAEGRAIVFCEGEKKTLYLAQLGYLAVGASGVDCFHDAEARDLEGLKRFPDWFLDDVPTTGRAMVVCFDADVATKPEVRDASKRLAGIIEGCGGRPLLVAPPEGQPLKGIDDYGAEHGADAVAELMKAASRITDAVSPKDPDQPVLSVVDKGSPLSAALRWPRAYEYSARTGLWREGKEGEEAIRIMSRPILPSRIMVDVVTGEERLELAYQREGAWRSHVIARRASKSSRTIVDALADVGADIDAHNAVEVVRFLTAFEELNEKRLPRVACSNRCGWHPSPDPEADPRDRVFVAPGLVEVPEGSDERRIVFGAADGRGNVIRGLGVRRGATFEGHRAALARAIAVDKAIAIAVFASLASPLIELLGARSFLVHFMGDSSTGKSSGQRIAGSVYGNPFDRSWISTWNATAVGLEVKAATLAHLPFLVDEVGAGTDSRSRAATLYQLVDGTGKARGTKEGGLQVGREWNLITISTGEVPIVEAKGPTGAAVRTIEILVDGIGELDAAGVDELVADAVEHYGAFGAAWLDLLGSLSADSVATLAADYNSAVATFREDTPEGSLPARQAAYWASMAIAEALAHRELGLGLGGLVRGIALEQARFEAGRVVPAHIRAMEAIRDSIARDRDAWPLMGMTSKGQNTTKASVRRLMGFRRDGVAHIPTTAFGELVGELGLAARPVLNGLSKTGELLDGEAGRKSSQLRVNGSRIRVYSIRVELEGETFDDEGGDGDDWGDGS